jgi:hypothetical protein
MSRAYTGWWRVCSHSRACYDALLQARAFERRTPRG